MKINDYNLEPLTPEELFRYIANNSNCVNAMTVSRLEYLGLVFGGRNNTYGYVSWAVSKSLLEELYALMTNTFKGDLESKQFAWAFFYNCAKSSDFAKECYDRFRNPA